MDNDYEYRKRLWSQLTEFYAKEVYSRETQNVAANSIKARANRISVTQTVLTSIATVGFVSVIVPSGYIGAVIASACSAVTLALNLYSRGANLPEQSTEHVKASNELWAFEQKLLSLLTDFDNLDVESICRRRDELFEELDAIYRDSPRTNERQYNKAREVLVMNEAQSFANGEVDNLLPANLKNKYRR